MLTDDQLHLITTSIDGELNPSEFRQFQRLLDSSSEARELHHRLKTDSERMRALPRLVPPADLHARVMRKIAAMFPEKVEPATVPVLPQKSAWRDWAPIAVAASLMVGVAASSFWFFRDTRDQNQAIRPAPLNNVVNPHDWEKSLPDGNHLPSAPPPRLHIDSGSIAHGGQPTPPVILPQLTPIAPEPRSAQPDTFTFPPIVGPKFDHVKIRVPFLRSVAEFDRAENRQDLAEELARDPAYRIDVFTRDPARAVEVFQAAAKSAGLQVHADATTIDRLKKRQVNAVMIYTEALNEAELAAVFGRLSVADAKISPRVFDSLHAIPVTRTDERYVIETLGRDPGLFKRADSEKRVPKADPNKPISDGTAQHIVDRVGGAGGANSSSDKPAVLLAWAPPAMRTVPSASAELKQFFAKRGDRKPGAVPVVIVIRPGNG